MLVNTVMPFVPNCLGVLQWGGDKAKEIGQDRKTLPYVGKIAWGTAGLCHDSRYWG